MVAVKIFRLLMSADIAIDGPDSAATGVDLPVASSPRLATVRITFVRRGQGVQGTVDPFGGMQ